MKTYEELYNYLKLHNNEQLLRFYDELSEDEKTNLISQIESIDFDYMKNLYDNMITEYDTKDKEITAMPVIDSKKIDIEKYINDGKKMITNGELAICSMAGGQGTRLGYDGPKGTFMLDLADIYGKQVSIFETTVIKLKESYEKYGVLIYWYIMTSNQNHDVTVKFFEDNNYFDYPKDHILFFKQAELPLLDEDGKVILKDRSNIFMAPDGNGGIFAALGKEGIISHMKKHNIKYLAIGNVDNILINMVSPDALGVMLENNAKVLAKSFMKPSPDGKWGVFCKINGVTNVIDYTETPRELLEARNEIGELIYGDAHFGCNFFDVDFLEQIVTEKLPMHVAKKKNKCINESNELVEADTYKFEAFIFDVFGKADNVIIYRVKREDEFAPIKNKEGQETPESAIALYKSFNSKRK